MLFHIALPEDWAAAQAAGAVHDEHPWPDARRGGLHPLLVRRAGRGDGDPLLRRRRRGRPAADRSRPAVEPRRRRGPRRQSASRSPTSTARSTSPPSCRRPRRPRRHPLLTSGSASAQVRILGLGATPPALGRRPAAAAAVAGLQPGPLLGLQRHLLGDEPLEAGEAVGVERAVVDGRPHGAARLLVVLAVAEPAVLHQLEDVGEGPLDALARQPQAEGPDARRVDQPAAGRAAAAARRRPWCDGRDRRRCAPRSSPARATPSRALTSVDLPTPLAPRKASVRPPSANARSVLDAAAGRARW